MNTDLLKQIHKLSLREVSSLIQSSQISSRELTQACLERMDADTNAYITVCEKSALRDADLADKMIKNGENGCVLTGIPMAIKDNICTRGIKTTCASKMLADHTPVYDATAYKSLKERGAVLIGKTNMDEFGMGSTTENSAFGAVKNPLDKNRSAGGSSGGSAAAVADGSAFYALGSDTGGSIRLPAAFCGLVGLCPTYGAVSRYGLIAYASSLDRVAPIAKSVRDCRAVFDAIKGTDSLDQTSYYPSKNTSKRLENDLNGVKIAIISQLWESKMNEKVKIALQKCVSRFEELGAAIDLVDISDIEHSVSAYYIISCAQVSSNLARYDGVRYGSRDNNRRFGSYEELATTLRSENFGKEARRRILLGTYMLSAENREKYYKSAVNYQRYIQNKLKNVLSSYDLILSPVYADLPPMLGDFEKDPVSFYENDLFCLPFSLAKLPSICLPTSFWADGLPVGFQLCADSFCEELLFDVAEIYERRAGI